MSLAQELADNPTPEVEAATENVIEVSAASESQARCDLRQEDGSVLSIVSFQGGAAEVVVSTGGAELDEEGGVLRYATPVDVPIPALPESEPQGIQSEDEEIPYCVDVDGEVVEGGPS